jgi:cytochrome P450
MMKVTLKIICKSILDYDLNSQEAQQFTKAFEISKKYFKRLQHPIGHILDHVPILPKVIESREAVKTIDSIIYRLIVDKKKLLQNNLKANISKSEDDLLTRLLQAQITLNSKSSSLDTKNDEDNNVVNEPSMNDQQIRDNVVTMLIAGHETTANALTWTYYLISQHPQIEKKMLEEIDSIVSKNNGKNENERIRAPSIKDLSKLKYVEKVLRESLRMYPLVWSIGRSVEDDYLIDKYTIPKGSSIVMSQYVMHHDSRFYDNPDEFNPDRWTDEFKRSLPRFSYFPFGGGIRGCIGEPFSWQEGILLMATISSNWTMSIVPKQKIKMDPGITLNPKNGIKMKLSLRRKLND